MPNYFTYLTHADNKAVATATTVSASSEASGYAASNLKLLPVSKHWRSTGDSSEYVEFDLGSAQSISMIALLNHNLTSAATITVRAGSSAAPNGSQFETTLTYREFDAFKLLAAAESWRYWRIIFADASNPDGYIKVGIVMLGSYTTLAFHWQYGAMFTDSFTNIHRRTGGGAVYAEAVFGIIRHTFSFGPLTQANMATLRTLYRTLRGSANPLFVIPEYGTYEGYFGRFTSEFARTLNFHEYVDLEFEEDGRGRDIDA